MSYQTIISPEDLHQLVGRGEVRVLDCRFSLADTNWGRNEYLAGHIPGAIYAHLDDDLSADIIRGQTGRHPLPEPAVFAGRLSQWGITPDDTIVCYDQSHGGIAARAWWMMQWMGHGQVAVLDGGWAAWVLQEYTTTDAKPHVEPSVYPERIVQGLTVTAEQVNQWRLNKAFCVVDARAQQRYLGRHEPIDAIAGHIPGAINLPFSENVHPDGSWKSPAVLKQRFLSGIAVDVDRVAFHCGSGVTACHNILAYRHAGMGMPLLYPGSWSEWITDPDRPVAMGH